MTIEGRIVNGVGHFRGRMTKFAAVFERHAGGKLFPGTLNVKVDKPIPVREDFRIPGKEINEPNQDLIFERCRINGIDAFRIRPCDAQGNGGHGDDTLGIASAQEIPDVPKGRAVTVELFRDDTTVDFQ